MDVLDETSTIESETFALQDITFLVLGKLEYDEIITTAQSSKIFMLTEAFWRAKVLSILDVGSASLCVRYAAELKLDRDNREKYLLANQTYAGYVPPYINQAEAKQVLRAMDELAAQSILLCRIPYVRILYEMNPELLRAFAMSGTGSYKGKISCNKAHNAISMFFKNSFATDCMTAYTRLFEGDYYFRVIGRGTMPERSRNIIGLPGKTDHRIENPLSQHGFFSDIDGRLALTVPQERPKLIEDMFFYGLRSHHVIPTDFALLLQPKYLDLIRKNTRFYLEFTNYMYYSDTLQTRAKHKLLIGTSIVTHKPIHIFLFGVSKRAIKAWLTLGLQRENIVQLQLARVDVTDEFAPIFLPLFHSKGYRVRSFELEDTLLTRTLLLCWLDQSNVEHSYRITLKIYQTLCDLIYKPDSRPETYDYMKGLLASNLGTLQIYELYWMFEKDHGEIYQRPIGGSVSWNVDRDNSRQGVYRDVVDEIQDYVAKKNKEQVLLEDKLEEQRKLGLSRQERQSIRDGKMTWREKRV